MSFSTHLLVADDLTGAADCAAYAPALGLSATIYLNAFAPVLADDLQLLSTHSRALGAHAARAAVLAGLRLQRNFPAARCFKKIDSQLRGNVGAELEAMLDHLAAPAALVCPALPVQGRSVVHGRTAGRATDSADAGAAIGPLLAAQTMLPQAHIQLEHVRSSNAALRMKLGAACAQARLVIADAESDRDLDALVAAWRTVAPTGLLCGSAGLAAAWLRAAAHRAAAALPALEQIPPVDLVVVGSASAMAHAQIAAAAALADVVVVALESDALPEIEAGKRPILHLPGPASAPAQAARMAGARRLAQAAAAYMRRVPVRHVLVVGGDTAQALAARLALTRLEVLAAALPGMPTCAAPRDNGAALWFTLKAGNHGNVNTVVQLMQG